MKAAMVFEVLLLVLLLSIGCVFAINTDIVRTSEASIGIESDVKAVSEAYIEGTYATDNDYYAAMEKVLSSYEKNGRNVNIYVLYADQEQGIADVYVEYTYKQFNGKECVKTLRETVIKDGTSCRSISAKFYKTADGSTFVDEKNGGLKADSKWRESANATILDSVFNNKQNSAGIWTTLKYSS